MTSFLRRFVDKLQVWLYLTGSVVLAGAVGRLGTPAPPSPTRENEHPLLTMGERTVAPTTGSMVEQQRWTTEDWHPAEPLVIIDFDLTFRRNDPRVDPSRDVACASSERDKN